MPTISFSPNIRSLVAVDSCEISEATTVKDALESVFEKHTRLESCLFDDDGTLRKHIAIIVNSEPIEDRDGLSDPIEAGDDIFVMQALSGG